MGKRERMSRKLDAWLGRSFKVAKLNSLLNLTVSRLAVLRNQRRVRCDHARSDVAELLRQGQQERALLRAEYVIKEENMLDAFAMVESYCHVVTERSTLLENQKDCPKELREAISGLIFAESRCGELPELHEVRSILASRLGKEFVAAAVELRNNCGVNSRIIQKMSTKQPSLESRTKVAKDIAAEQGIALHLEELPSELPTPPSSPPTQPDAAAADAVSGFSRDEYLAESVKVKEKYKNAASAAQAAFESAAYAAAAARAAVELSRSGSQGKFDPGDQSSPRAPARATSGGRSYPVQSSSSETESENEMEQSMEPVPFPREGEKRMVDDASEEVEEESEEEEGPGGGELMGNQPAPMQSSAPGSRNRPEHGFQARGEIGVRSDEDTSSEEEEEEIKPQMAAFRWRSPAGRQGSWERSQHREPNRAEARYRKGEEEREREEEEDTATHGSEKPSGRNVAGRVPVNRVGVGKGPVSMRTRRSGF